jgi:hypothetical protein
MSHRSDEERLELYRKSLAFAWGFSDYNDWPVKLNSVFHLFLEEFGRDVLEDLEFLEQEKKLSLEEIASTFQNPARIYRMIDSTMYSMRRKGYSLQYQREIALKMLSMVASLKYGSEFNEDGRNIIYDPETVAGLAGDKLKDVRCTVDESTRLHRFCGMIWAYTEAIFFRAHDVTKEIHGPYRYDHDNSKVLVKEYLNLRPTDIWPDVRLLPCSTIRIFKNYTDDICLSIDALNHLYHDGGSVVPNLLSYCVEIDGQEETVDRCGELTETISGSISEIVAKTEAMTWHEKVTKYAEIFWFRKKPLRDACGRPWRLPESVCEQIRNGTVNPTRVSRLAEDQVYRLAMLTV